jgi:hypothetical protein
MILESIPCLQGSVKRMLRQHVPRYCWVGEDRDVMRFGVERSLIA